MDSEDKEKKELVPDILKNTKLMMQNSFITKVNNDSNSTMDGLGKAAVVGDDSNEYSRHGPANQSETETFIALFCSDQGINLKICPEKWTVDDQRFGAWWDTTNSTPKSFVDIRKEVYLETEGLQQQMTDKEILVKWAEMKGKQKPG